jgi:hypothetical protein
MSGFFVAARLSGQSASAEPPWRRGIQTLNAATLLAHGGVRYELQYAEA